MAANTLTLREENDEKLFHLLAAARDLMKTFKKSFTGCPGSRQVFFKNSVLGYTPRLIKVGLGS